MSLNAFFHAPPVFDTNFPAKLPFGQPGLYFLLPSVFFGPLELLFMMLSS